MAQDFLEQLALDPANPKTWEPLLRHAAEEMADEIVEGAPSNPGLAQSTISTYVFLALTAIVDSVSLAGSAIGESRAVEALLERNPSCREAFGDFETFRDALIEEERRSALGRLLKQITTSFVPSYI